MEVSLGIHVGHDAAVAVVRDGRLASAICQERTSRLKHDGQHFLTNSLPIEQCLKAAGSKLDDVSYITTSIQSAAPGGVGLGTPLVDPFFAAFDVDDPRHHAVSHHLAHALSGNALSGFKETAVLVYDRAGSSTSDGKDFYLPFRRWKQTLGCGIHQHLITENLSVYKYNNSGQLKLLAREYCAAHNAPDVFVDSVSALYENVSRFVFQNSDAHGQLMALAGLAQRDDPVVKELSRRMWAYDPRRACVLLNGWQTEICRSRNDESDYVQLASAVQGAAEAVISTLARNATAICGTKNLIGVGGSFLNILAAERCASLPEVEQFFVPPAPHDAGIAVGCAFAPYYMGTRSQVLKIKAGCPTRLGPLQGDFDLKSAIKLVRWAVSGEGAVASPELVANLLFEGLLIARCSGRSEFGPRALGGRSLLASPFTSGQKSLLNIVKGRQDWRPVAPLLPYERYADYFEGPPPQHMQYSAKLRPTHAVSLDILTHTDGTARPQALSFADDEWLHRVLTSFGIRTGHPILFNTSFNVKGEPIVESFRDALASFLMNDQIDLLLLNDYVVRRLDDVSLQNLVLRDLRLHPRATLVKELCGKRVFSIVAKGEHRLRVPDQLFSILQSGLTRSRLGEEWSRLKREDVPTIVRRLASLLLKGYVTYVEF